MRVLLAVGIAAITAAAAGAVVLAGPPPQPFFLFGTTRAQPVAGERFTGLTVGYISNRLTRLECHAKVGAKPLVGRVQAFYTHDMAGPATASCSWLIPSSAAGKTLHAWDGAYFSSGSYEGSGYVAKWHIKP